MSNSKVEGYRGFWIYIDTNQKHHVHELPNTFGDDLYVIEYQALLDECEAHKKTAAALQSELDETRALCRELLSLLYRVQGKSEIMGQHGMNFLIHSKLGDDIHDSLTKVRKLLGDE